VNVRTGHARHINAVLPERGRLAREDPGLLHEVGERADKGVSGEVLYAPEHAYDLWGFFILFY
jgi:hypothetical protein